ncbi:hypothetical protein [Yimella lutea]|nr:hypothetical protein [Yimella lutea]
MLRQYDRRQLADAGGVRRAGCLDDERSPHVLALPVVDDHHRDLGLVGVR